MELRLNDIIYSLDIIKYPEDLLVMVYADRTLVFTFWLDPEPSAVHIIREAVRMIRDQFQAESM